MEQDKAMRAAVHLHGAVFQYGTQQRSFSPHCGFACELVRNGYIGDLKAVHVVAPNGDTGGNAVPQPVPEGLDYDLWLGPAPVTPFTQRPRVRRRTLVYLRLRHRLHRRLGRASAGRRSLGLPTHPRGIRGHRPDSDRRFV